MYDKQYLSIEESHSQMQVGEVEGVVKVQSYMQLRHLKLTNLVSK